MSEERRQILQMLHDGTITTDQAMALLNALDVDEIPQADSHEEALAGEIIHSESPPDMDRYRHFWKIPFVISVAFVLIFGLWLRSIYQFSNGALSFAFICVWSLFMLALVATLLAFFSRRATWLHVRVKEKEGRRIAISLPLPLGLAGVGIRIANGFVDEQTRGHLTMASEFLAAAKDELRQPGAEPLTINVDDDDGDQVQVFIG